MKEHGCVLLTYAIQVQRADLTEDASRDACIYNVLQLLLWNIYILFFLKTFSCVLSLSEVSDTQKSAIRLQKCVVLQELLFRTETA